MNTPFRAPHFILLLAMAAMACIFAPSAAALPDDLKLTVTTSDGPQTLNLHKRTARTSDSVIYLWSAAKGYVPITPEVRTYRGTITENPNAIVIAAIGGDNKLKACCIDMEWGHNFRWVLEGTDVSSQLEKPDTQAAPMPSQPVGKPRNGTPRIPDIGPKVPTGKAPNGVPYGDIVEYELALDLSAEAYGLRGKNIDSTLAEYEADVLVYEMMMLRDMHVRVVVPTIVIRTEPLVAGGPASISLGDLPGHWLKAPLFGSRWDGVWGSEGGVANGNAIGKDQPSFSVGALYHENTHNWTAYHLAYQCDTMGGNKPSIGPMTVETMTKKRKEAIDQGKLPVAAPFTDPIPPHTHVDAVRTPRDTAVVIDVMANDHDGNGDSLSICDFTKRTVPGGVVKLADDKLHYTPPAGYVGKDMLIYTVQDDSPMKLKTREVVHIEVGSGDLVVCYPMEQTSGTSIENTAPGGVPGDLNGANFATDRVPSPLGHGIRASGFPNDDDIEDGNWSGILLGSACLMPAPLNPSRLATPFEHDYNRNSAAYDIMDGDYTFATWFRCDDYDGRAYPGGFDMAYIASRWWHPETRVGWDLYAMDGTIGMHYRIFDGATEIQEFSTPYKLTPGKWYHIAAVFDRAAKQIRILVDGKVVAAKDDAFASNGYIFNGRAPLALGAFSRDKFHYDDVRIYTRALDVTEVRALIAQAGSGGPRFLNDTIAITAFAGKSLNRTVWSDIWSGGDEPLTFRVIHGPKWLAADTEGFLTGTPTVSDAGASTATLEITGRSGHKTSAKLAITVPAVPTGAIAEWKFDEAAGDKAVDSSGNKHDGKFLGASRSRGLVQGAVRFAKPGAKVDCGEVPSAAAMSFAAWVKPTGTDGVQILIAKGNSYQIKMSGTELIYTRPGVDDYAIGGVGLKAGEWQHIVVTVNGDRPDGVKAYKNGVFVAQTTATAPDMNPGTLFLGGTPSNHENFSGDLDDVRIYHSILTAGQVGALHASTSGNGLLARWKFDETSGAIAVDVSGNGNNGKLDPGIASIPGKTGRALALTPTKQITLPGKTDPAGGEWTFTTWVRRKGDTPAAVILDGPASSIRLEQWPDTHRVGITRRDAGNWAFNYTAPLNEWVHLALVFSKGSTKLYTNGEPRDTLDQTIDMPFATIGSATEGLNADIDETMIFTRALTAEEVKKLGKK